MVHHEDGELSKAPVSTVGPSDGKKPSGELTDEEMAEFRRFYAVPDVITVGVMHPERKMGTLRNDLKVAEDILVNGLIRLGEQAGG